MVLVFIYLINAWVGLLAGVVYIGNRPNLSEQASILALVLTCLFGPFVVIYVLFTSGGDVLEEILKARNTR